MFPAPNLDLTFSEQRGRKQDGASEDSLLQGKQLTLDRRVHSHAVLICQATEVFIHQRGRTNAPQVN